MIAVICIVILTVFIAAAVGYLGYLAFGATTKSVILFNLPNQDVASILAKCFYVLTIMGSFVIIINPVFRVIENSGWYRKCAGMDDGPEPPALKRQGSNQPALNLARMDSKLSNKDQNAPAQDLEDKNSAGLEGGSNSQFEEDPPFTWCSGFMYFGIRTLVVIILCLLAFLIPNINILLIIGGAVLGTIVNILLPVLFYNRAYSFSNKNRALEVDRAAQAAN